MRVKTKWMDDALQLHAVLNFDDRRHFDIHYNQTSMSFNIQ